MTNPRRGELYWVDWSPGRGSEQSGRRPALIVQTDAGNRNPSYPNTIVVCVTSRRRAVSTHVEVEPSEENHLRETSYIKCEQLFTVSKDRLQGFIGSLARAHMDRVDQALSLVLELN